MNTTLTKRRRAMTREEIEAIKNGYAESMDTYPEIITQLCDQLLSLLPATAPMSQRQIEDNWELSKLKDSLIPAIPDPGKEPFTDEHWDAALADKDARIASLEQEVERLKRSNQLYFENSERDDKDAELLHEQIAKLQAENQRLREHLDHMINQHGNPRCQGCFDAGTFIKAAMAAGEGENEPR